MSKFDLSLLKSPVLIVVVVIATLLLALLIAYGDSCTPSASRFNNLSWGSSWHGATRWDCLKLGFLR